jgi:hypothetical protein
MFSFCDCVSYGEIGGLTYAAPTVGLAGKAMPLELKGAKVKTLDREFRLEDGAAESNEGALAEPNDSERSISGGERSEETVRRWLGGVG